MGHKVQTYSSRPKRISTRTSDKAAEEAAADDALWGIRTLYA